MGGLLMFAVSVAGSYVGMVYQQVKGRSAHIVETGGGVGRAADGRHRPEVEK